MLDEKNLIYEAMQIAAGQSLKLATKEHLIALLSERTDMMSALQLAYEGLQDAAGMDEEWRIAAMETTGDNVNDFNWLDTDHPEWRELVLSARRAA